MTYKGDDIPTEFQRDHSPFKPQTSKSPELFPDCQPPSGDHPCVHSPLCPVQSKTNALCLIHQELSHWYFCLCGPRQPLATMYPKGCVLPTFSPAVTLGAKEVLLGCGLRTERTASEVGMPAEAC